MEVRRSELTTLFAHYDYFTGRAIRIVLNKPAGIESPHAFVVRIDTACQCLVNAKKAKVGYVSAAARDIAHDAYKTLGSVADDLQMKVLECCATSRPGSVQNALLALLERELAKATQPEIV